MYNRWVDRPPPRPSAGGNRAQPAPKEKRPPVQRTDGLQSLLNGLLGGKLDTSDIILLLILLLLPKRQKNDNGGYADEEI